MAQYFVFSEFTDSTVAKKYRIDNTPSQEISSNINKLMEVMDKFRTTLGKPIRINSGYRCHKLNSHKEIGGASNSAHLTGWACDFVCTKEDIDSLYTKFLSFLKTNDIKFDEVFVEKNRKGSRWIHFALFNPKYGYRMKEGYIKKND